MGKAKRKKEVKKVKAKTRKGVVDNRPAKYASRGTLCVGEENCQAGCVVVLTRLPKDIKKAKKKFKVGKEYVIQEPKGNRLNTLHSIYLKDKEGEVHQILFAYYRLTGRLANGKKVPGTYINQPDKKKKKKKDK